MKQVKKPTTKQFPGMTTHGTVAENVSEKKEGGETEIQGVGTMK